MTPVQTPAALSGDPTPSIDFRSGPTAHMATIAIGDIHGAIRPLDDLLGQVAGEVSMGDTVVFLGDYIDRGSDSKACVDAILAFRTASPATVVALCGNHEDWLLQTMANYRRHSWMLAMDVFDTIHSYCSKAADAIYDAKRTAGGLVYEEKCTLPYELFFDAMPPSHIDFFKDLARYHRTHDCFCAHAGVDPRVSNDEQHARTFVWGTDRFPEQYTGEEIIVYGHFNNAVIDGHGWPQPRFEGHTIGIDTIRHGVLTAIRLPDARVIQSRRYANE